MPAKHHSCLNRAIQRIINQVDPARSHGAQLEQAAGAAVRYGLRRAAQGRGLGQTASPTLRAQLETAVASFAAETNQADLERAARQAGVSPADALAGVVLRHCHEDLKPLTADQVVRYGLEFALALAETRPLLAARYRRWLGRGRPPKA